MTASQPSSLLQYAVPVGRFQSEMTTRWQQDLGNIASQPLQHQWGQICHVLNTQVLAYGTPQGQEWQIIAAPTGTAKTKGLAVYCALLAELQPFDHPGVLCVTKMRAEADDLAATINEWSGGSSVAIAYHGEAHDVKVADLALYSTLVITHAAYQRALDAVTRGNPTLKSWAAFTRWHGGGSRKLIVIDEAIELCEEATVDVDTVTRVLGYIPLAMTQRFPAEVKAIRTLRDKLEEIALEKTDGNGVESIISNGSNRLFGDVDLTEFRRAMQSECRYDRANMTHDQDERRRLAMIVDGIFRKIQLNLEQWLMYAKVPHKGELKHTLNTAKLLVPEGSQGCVVLDATARINPVYQLFNHAKIWPRVEGTRSYRNVRLHISKGHAVGKSAILRTPEKQASEFVGALKADLADRKVFVICHKDLEPTLEKYKPSDSWMFSHWGAITGKNDWQDCDAVAVIGLPYKPDVSSALEFMAFQGVQTDQWLANRGDRPFAGHTDIRHAMKVGSIASDLVQGLNRAKFRKVIDALGNCAEGDAYLVLPGGPIGDELLAIIQEEMPGVQIIPWTYSGAQRRARPSHHEDGLIKWIKFLPHGKHSAMQVRTSHRLSKATWRGLMAKINNPSSKIATAMRSTGIRYQKGGGRGCASYFVKN